MLNYYHTPQVNYEGEKDLPLDLRPDLPKLMIMPSADPFLPRSMTEAVLDKLKNAKVVWLEGTCGHWVQLERPREIEEIIGEWVEELVGSS
ncbi:hypothetical protein RSOLAG1IB_10438 [Rhizoctonia solani AG-1 IB]|jgi:pimeloyl-ACP methyl ester carboxylesterase|uniref:Alpha/beta hydrolase n=1 Tax=Thanatephorus cucumeris (strain AG1-IB / isolate 7/3/14) TaxID=1108050 RepID=A0A0B7G1Q2_THACB|nr:hypothetical protein RSOLAG1IB_10438 [Rhizoctonia solani AG-1 IB]